MADERNESGSAGGNDKLSDLLRMIAFFVILIVPFLTTKTEYQFGVQRELYQTLDLLPAPVRAPVLTYTHDAYQVVMFNTRFYGFLTSSLLPDPNKVGDGLERTASKFLIISQRIIDNTPLLIYQILFRLIASLSWIVILLPLTVAGVYAGIQYWRLAGQTGINVKIERYKIFRRLVGLSGWLYLAYLIIPALGFYPLSHLMAPVIVIFVSIMINQMIKSYHTMI